MPVIERVKRHAGRRTRCDDIRMEIDEDPTNPMEGGLKRVTGNSENWLLYSPSLSLARSIALLNVNADASKCG